jgi:hypothetical protein
VRPPTLALDTGRTERVVSMKLIFCPSCGDVVRLVREVRHCQCRQSWGYYTNAINAKIGGLSIPLGIDNGSLQFAINRTPHQIRGSTFSAFVIKMPCDTVCQEGAQE